MLHDPNNANSLADALRPLIQNRVQGADMGRKAQRVVHQQYSADRMAQQMIELYNTVGRG